MEVTARLRCAVVSVISVVHLLFMAHQYAMQMVRSSPVVLGYHCILCLLIPTTPSYSDAAAGMGRAAPSPEVGRGTSLRLVLPFFALGGGAALRFVLPYFPKGEGSRTLIPSPLSPLRERGRG
jgi:hypothetical protein